jgi:cytochrome c-type biogenesis protein CcmE
MKTSNIIVLVLLAIGIGIIISFAIKDSSSYVSFADAEQIAKAGNNKSIHVVGSLKKDASGNFEGMRYDALIDPNRFEFVMIDSLNYETKVVYNQPKPADLDQAEKLVVVGKMDLANKCFNAEQILLKCPSKYNNNKLEAEEPKKTVSMK